MRKLPALTGLRFVAAAGVLLFHALLPRLSSYQGPAINVIAAGYVGVSLFFVLSGFILAYTYLSAEGTMRGTSRAFLRARFARVYPVYLLCLIVSLPLFVRHEVVHQSVAASVLQAITAPLLLQSWFPTAACAWNCPGWSLSVEALFYLSFPFVGLLMVKLSNRSLGVAAAACWIAGLVAPLLYLGVHPDGAASVTRLDGFVWLEALKFTPVFHLPEFVLGVVTGLLFVRRWAIDSGAIRFAWLAPAAIGVVTIALANSDLIPYPLLHNGLLAPLFALAIYSLACRGGLLGRVLSAPALVLLGEASYALYLIHVPIRDYANAAQKALPALQRIPTSLWFSGYVVVTVGCSLLIYRFVEEPARRYLRHGAVRDPAGEGAMAAPVAA